jgi:hypothetical protein
MMPPPPRNAPASLTWRRIPRHFIARDAAPG